ncbi:MAG: substrate-binding domain-containing protein [Acidobacteria bacterium]|nr:substrate-binding domain-containing protein [Acidobacteriota bacterium]
MSSRSPEINLQFQISNLKLFVTLVALFVFSGCGGPRPQAQTAAQQQAQPPTSQQKFERPAGVLRVCADPNNLPFSNERGEGFENKIAELLAGDLHERLEYTWWAQRRGFFRNTLKAGACDVVLGVPSSFELAATTAPYYRSTYVFVYRKGKGLNVHSFDDAVLHDVKVGVQLVGDDGADTPPVHALSARGVINNVRGYTLYGDYRQPNPPARIVEAVAKGEVDVAVAWGPLAGYFAPRQRVPLEVVPVSPQFDLPFLPFVYDISMGVRRGDEDLRQQLEGFLERRRPEIERILDDYGVPRAAAAQVVSASAGVR